MNSGRRRMVLLALCAVLLCSAVTGAQAAILLPGITYGLDLVYTPVFGQVIGSAWLESEANRALLLVSLAMDARKGGLLDQRYLAGLMRGTAYAGPYGESGYAVVAEGPLNTVLQILYDPETRTASGKGVPGFGADAVKRQAESMFSGGEMYLCDPAVTAVVFAAYAQPVLSGAAAAEDWEQMGFSGAGASAEASGRIFSLSRPGGNSAGSGSGPAVLTEDGGLAVRIEGTWDVAAMISDRYSEAEQERMCGMNGDIRLVFRDGRIAMEGAITDSTFGAYSVENLVLYWGRQRIRTSVVNGYLVLWSASDNGFYILKEPQD